MSPPIALSIAGSDPSGGAGIQADVKTFSALGVYGCAVLTSLTAQNTRGVADVHVVPADFVSAQLNTLVADVRIDAVKIGMLADAAIVQAVDEFLAKHPELPVVLDPVMVATSGDRLLAPDAVVALRNLMRRVELITPNLAEAAALLEVAPATDLATMTQQAASLRAMGARQVLIKGGHLADQDAIDVYAGDNGVEQLVSARVATTNTHGTGCTLSAAIAARVAAGDPWPTAVRRAKTYLTDALVAADRLSVGSGRGPVHHFREFWDETERDQSMKVVDP